MRPTTYAGTASTTATCSSTPRESTRAFTEFARELIEAAFAPARPPCRAVRAPRRAVRRDRCAPLQPAFIHHPESKKLIAAILDEVGCDPDQTYFDVPRMRVQAHDAYLTAGVGYQLHPHRDTWYAAPPSQVNFWLPVYPISSECTFAFFPKYFHNPVQNDSDRFDMYEWNAKARKNAAKEVRKDSRWQPTAQEALDLETEFRVVCPPGGLIMFSGAAPAHDRAEHLRAHAFQCRLPHRPPRRCRRATGCAEARLVRAGHDLARAHAGERPRAAPRGPGADLRPRPAGRRGARLQAGVLTVRPSGLRRPVEALVDLLRAQ